MAALLLAALAALCQFGAALRTGTKLQSQEVPGAAAAGPEPPPCRPAEAHQRWPPPAPAGLPDWGAGGQAVGPELFVAVFSTAANAPRRRAIRQAWKIPANVTVKFVLCDDSGREESEDLRGEMDEYRDILRLNCTEGYSKGLLTAKVLALLQVFRIDYQWTPWFFKTDDDSLPDLEKLQSMLRPLLGEYVYGGLWFGPAPVKHDPEKKWYEPTWTYPESQYPESVAGGPGYVLSSTLVDHIVTSGVAEQNMLWNEDKAVAVWVDQLKRSGLTLHKLAVSGFQGFTNSFTSKCLRLQNSTPQTNNITLLHHLTPQEMLCFRRVNATVDKTFRECFCERLTDTGVPVGTCP